MGIKNFILPSKDLYHPLVVQAILNSTGLLPNQQVVSHTSCPVLVKPAGHSKNTTQNNSTKQRGLGQHSNAQQFPGSFYLCKLEKNLVLISFSPSKDILLALEAPESVCQVHISLGQFSVMCYTVH